MKEYEERLEEYFTYPDFDMDDLDFFDEDLPFC